MNVDWSKMTEEIYKCPDCGFHFNIWRKMARRRSSNHIKGLFCVSCNKKKQFRRVIDALDYQKKKGVQFWMK